MEKNNKSRGIDAVKKHFETAAGTDDVVNELPLFPSLRVPEVTLITRKACRLFAVQIQSHSRELPFVCTNYRCTQRQSAGSGRSLPCQQRSCPSSGYLVTLQSSHVPQTCDACCTQSQISELQACSPL